ncbi:PAS domain-containing protein [Phenylobacterium sp.]|uniref:PAS domain-containing protein n=1 Tax=Phenylobacterium sp. TaxID=1871053 RepID=UPI0025E84E51|nr:PAS domain-containing protein [Phenylobacterium sp.]MBX3484554.1 PAS domain-containing protein [Phenylobacterium sp.]
MRKSAEGAADKAEMARWLFDNSRDLMQVCSPEGVLLQVNKAWSQFTGLGEAELVGRSVLDFCHPDEVAGIRARAEAARPGDVSEAEVRLRAVDGAWVWVAARRQVMENGCHIGNMRDISAERAYREESEEARRTRKLLGASAGLGIWEFDPRTGLIWWSDEILGLVGFDPDVEWTAERFYEFVHPKDREPLSKTLAQAVETGEAVKVEHRIWARDRWLTMRVTVRTEPTEAGAFVLKGISEDITQLAEARDAARRGEQQARRARREVALNVARLNLALEAAEAGVYEIDHIRQTFWCSPEFERITGQKNSSYREATELRYPGFHADDLPHVRASFRALHRGDKNSGESFEARIVRPDGTERWVRVFHYLLVGKNGRWLKAVGLVQDCDALKRQELALKEAQAAAEAAGEAKAAFLANMSHEIRTPMNGVMGVLHLLKGERLSDEGRALLREALSCGQMLSELLNDVIDFSKIEAGRLELACEPVDPTGLVAGVVRLLEPQARAKGLSIVVDADPKLGWVRSDPVRLRQALFNLVGNAVKFTEAGRVVVRCRRADAGVLRFEVEDTGIGIAAGAQHRLFERFNQADASTTRRFGGSGLGLAITRRLAEMMQGQVGFTSAEGQGSTFWFEVRAEAAEAQPEAVETTAGVLAGVRVLVVEDNATNRLIATKLLENLGAAVETAADGYAGVEAAARGGFDVVLMDIQMPGIDGVEAARRIRALGGAAAGTPIVALTANVLAHQRQAYIDAGMDGVVGKPIAPATLLAEIAHAAARRAGGEAVETAAA